MLIKRFLGANQRGDTIVEVLIAIAIVSVILSGAYAVTTQDMKATQDASERSQAQQLVQQQIELLRPYAAATSVTVPNGDCVKNGAASDPGGVALLSGANCKIQASGALCTASSSLCYTVSISLPSAGSYEITTTWPNQHGTNSTVIMDYGPASS